MIFLGILVLIAVIAVALYNSLVTAKNRVDEAWSDIEVQLKRRYDLVPNLVETVKGYAKQESSVLESVTQARSTAMGATSPEEKLKDENVLSGTLKSLFAVAESYPDLKSNQNFLQMQADLTDTENKLGAVRRFYNSTVRDYNTKLQTIPTNLFAQWFKFTPRPFFDIDETGVEGQPIKVQF